jgi:hypothetical protein
MNSSKSAFIATVAVALLAIAAAIFAYTSADRDELPPLENGAETDYRPSQELEDEMFKEAERLITNNHTIVKLYITHGVPVIKEPYANTTDRPLGNPPEDGFFYSASLKTLADVEDIVRETFLPDEVTRIFKNQSDDGTPYFSEYGVIFAEKRENREGVSLGINMHFALDLYTIPDFAANNPIDWEDNVAFDLTALSETECELRVRLTINGEPYVVTRRMTNYNGEGWRLDRLIYE